MVGETVHPIALDHAMTSIATRPDLSQPAAEMAVDLFENMGVELFVVRLRRIADGIPQRPMLPQPVAVTAAIG